MPRSRRQTNEEILAEGGLDPYQEDYLRAELERLKGRGPLPDAVPEAEPEQGWTDKAADLPGVIGRKLREGYNYWSSSPYRALEAPAQVLESISWPVTKAAELQPFSSGLQEAGKKFREHLHSKSVKYGELAGGYEPSTAAHLAGALKWPFPSFSKAGTVGKAIKQNVPKQAAAGAGYGAVMETDKPEAERDYLHGAGVGAAFGAGLGVLEPAAQGVRRWWQTPKKAPDLGVGMPGDFEPPSPPSLKQIPKREPLKQLEEDPIFDAEFDEVPPAMVAPPSIKRPQIEYREPQSEPIYAPGPVRTGEGAIEMPGPISRNPHVVEDVVARERFKDAPPMSRPEPVKFELPTELPIQQRPPVVTKKAVERPASIEAPKPEVRPELPLDMEPPPFVQQREMPTVRTLERVDKLPVQQIAATPRHKLPPELNDEMLERVQFAKDTMEIAGQERGFVAKGEQLGHGSDQVILGSSKSPTAQWYKDVTIDGGMKPQDVDIALQKIIEDHGKDKGAYVERVKEALFNDREFDKWYGQPTAADDMAKEFGLAPEEPVSFHDLPDEMLPPLEPHVPEIPQHAGLEHPFGQMEMPVIPQKKSEGADWFMNPPEIATPQTSLERKAQTSLDIPPPTIGERPIIGRDVNPDTAALEAPLFSKSAQLPEKEQVGLPGFGPVKAKDASAPKQSIFDEVDPESATEVSQEFHVEQEQLGSMWDTLNNERGSVKLGKGVTLIERGLSQRRMAERHPEFKPVYDTATYRGEFASSVKHDLRQLAEPYFKLGEADRSAVDQYLRARRAQQTTVGLRHRETGQMLAPLTAEQLQAVKAIDQSMASAYDLINDVRSTKGLPAIPPDLFYVPFTRSGDYLTILDGPNNQKWVSASTTLREAETLEKELQRKFPGSPTVVKSASGKKGDEPALDFGTLALLEKAGFLSPDGYEAAITQFNLPPGFSAHFRHAMKIMGEATNLTSPIERYIDSLGNYTSKFLYDDVMKGQIGKLKDPAMRQYAERYRNYLNEKPAEWSQIRGGVAVWDLMVNVGSMVQNASQVPVLGIPNLQRAVGAKRAVGIFKDAWGAVRKPSAQDQAILEMAQREGHLTPINAQELFGTRVTEPNSVELGSPYVQRLVDRGALTQGTASAIRKPIDAVAQGLSATADKFQQLNQGMGQKVSYALHRLTKNSVQLSEDAARKANPFLMQGFASIEELNRKWSILAGYRAGIEKGMNHAEAYEFGKQFSRDVNFDYSPISRPELFRGRKAIVGLFGTYPIEALSTYSKMAREATRGKVGPFGTAMGAFWTMAGIKGIPFVEDIDTYGPYPGALSQNLPDWMYHGPVSALTGTDIASKYKMKIPVLGDVPNIAHGELDLGTMPALQPFVQGKRTIDWFMQSPQDPAAIQAAGERLLPPALRSGAAAARWAGFGPAGRIEQGAVGTIKGHTPGPNAEGKKDFFHPSAKDIAGKALTFTPLELSKQYQRGRIAAVETDRGKAYTGTLIQKIANDLDRGVTSSKALQELAQKHPRSYQSLMKAHNLRQSGVRGSTFELYRKSQEPKPPTVAQGAR